MPIPKQSPSARAVAIDILSLWASSQQSLDLLFQDRISDVSEKDRALTKTLVFGIMRYKEYLDSIIRRFSKHPLRKMKPRTLMTLRVGAYQLLLLDRIPESAAVNSTVNTLKGAGQPGWLIGFVNGTLRAIARSRTTLPTAEQLQEAEPPILNHPSWLISRWTSQFGAQTTRAICRHNNREPQLSLRVNSRLTSTSRLQARLAQSGIAAKPGFFSPVALHIEAFAGGIPALPGYEEGLFQVQDEAAQLASLLIGPFPAGCRILDGCAGLGGKSSHLAELLPPTGTLVTVEPDLRRFRLLQANLRRLKLQDQVDMVHTDLQQYAAQATKGFDAIVIDAPCSGTGVIGRHPDIRWNRQPEDFAAYHSQQLQLLQTAAPLVKPGGILLYATCSLEAEENQDVIQDFLTATPAFSLENAQAILPENAGNLVTETGYFQPLPTQGLDGFFAARLRRADSL